MESAVSTEMQALVLATVLALVLHLALRRVARQAARALARREAGRGRDPLNATLRWRRRVEVVLVPVKLVLWLGVAALAAARFPDAALRLRGMASAVAESCLRPLVVVGGHGYSALDLVALPALLGTLWFVSGVVARAVGARVPRHGDGAAQDTLASLLRYATVFLGAIVVLQQWGTDVQSLAMAASVLGVGIGFGLQHIANNFVSGLLVGAERPIRPGDYVTLGDVGGTVERIGARSTEIVTNDRVKILVPNSRFLEQEVVNWTHGDSLCRLHVPVRVPYGADIAEVRGALLEAARGHPQVLDQPAPRAALQSLAEGALAFELLVWTRSPRARGTIVSDLNYRIDATFQRRGLDLRSPQPDLKLPPAIEEIVLAWARRELGVQAGTGAVPALAPRREARAVDGFDTSLAPRQWSDAQLRAMTARMRGLDGVSVLDRRHLLATYAHCFVGREAVDWLVRELRVPRHEAVELGRRLLALGCFHHVLDEHGFRDGHFFYRFHEEEELPARDDLTARAAHAAIAVGACGLDQTGPDGTPASGLTIAVTK